MTTQTNPSNTPVLSSCRAFLKEALSLGVFLLVALAMRSSIAATYYVPSGSMEPSVYTGDRLMAYQHSYGLRIPFTDRLLSSQSAPSYGDIVVFVDPRDPQTLLLKRVIAVGGDRLAIRDGVILRNGAPLPQSAALQKDGWLQRIESNGKHRYVVQFEPSQPFLRDMPTRTIPQGHFFAMGDNRDHSADSRVFGSVPLQNLRARAVRVLWSRDPATYWDIRWSRSGRSLR